MMYLLIVASVVACLAGQAATTPTVDKNESSGRQCDMVTSLSVDFTCPAGACAPRLPSGTAVRSSCKAGHTSPKGLEELRCTDGRWDKPTPKCHAVCGVENKPSRRRRIVHGADAVRGAFPWHVGIYRDFGTITFFCGGTLLQTNIVISAANCFYDWFRKAPLPATDYRVAVGKIYQSWNNEVERDLESVQKSEIKQIFLHENYGGDETNQQFDVSLLELATPVRLSAAVRPICMDLLDEEFDKRQLEPQSVGRIAGWGITEAGRTPSETLKTLSVPIVGSNECRQEMFQYKFTRYLTADKLCAGYTNGSSLCRGDAGGGLVFPEEGQGQQIRWFLRAVASVGPLDNTLTSCSTTTYTTYTHVFKLKDWIGRVLQALHSEELEVNFK